MTSYYQPESVKNAYLGVSDNKPQHTLLWLVDEHNLIMQGTLKPGSLKNYYTTARYLKLFFKKNTMCMISI